MILWIASYGRSGNTFFRIVLHHLYNLDTYAAFNASEVLVTAGADDLVGHKQLPEPLRGAVASSDATLIHRALDDLESRPELFVFKTHAWPNQLFGTNYRAILLVRDGRDALASYANYLVDIRFDTAALRQRLRDMRRAKLGFLDFRAWKHLAKIVVVASAKKLGLRQRLVSRRIDRLLREPADSLLDWTTMNRSWLEREPPPVIVYFDDLVRDPIAAVGGAVAQLDLPLAPVRGTALPAFGELRARYPSFFRSGKTGEWENHFSPAQAELFMNKHGAVMKTLGFTTGG